MSRVRCDNFFIQAINELKNDFNIIVTVTKKNKDRYAVIEGITLEEWHDAETMQKLCEAITPEQLRKITTIETELNLNCYNFNINYFLYEKFVNRYHGRSILQSRNKTIPQYILLEYEFLKSIVKKHKIEYAFFETLDLTETMILNAMAREKIIKGAFAQQSHSIGGEIRFRIINDQHCNSPKIDHIYNSETISMESIAWAEKTIKKYDHEKPHTVYDSYHDSLGKILPRYSWTQIKDKAKRILAGEMPLASLTKIKNRLLSRKYFTNTIPDGKIISYFLQLTPEATMCSQTPEFANQEHLIEQIAIHGKYGYTVVVKEHPICFGNRDPQFYKELCALPNVVIMPPSTPTRSIILRSKAVIVATATSVGFESICSRVPVICLGKPFFNICKNTITVEKPQEVWDVLNNLKNDRDEAVKFVAAMHQGTYKLPEFISIEDHTEQDGSGEVTAKALKDEVSFYENVVFNQSRDK
jgi:hypothetical protein